MIQIEHLAFTSFSMHRQPSSLLIFDGAWPLLSEEGPQFLARFGVQKIFNLFQFLIHIIDIQYNEQQTRMPKCLINLFPIYQCLFKLNQNQNNYNHRKGLESIFNSQFLKKNEFEFLDSDKPNCINQNHKICFQEFLQKLKDLQEDERYKFFSKQKIYPRFIKKFKNLDISICSLDQVRNIVNNFNSELEQINLRLSRPLIAKLYTYAILEKADRRLQVEEENIRIKKEILSDDEQRQQLKNLVEQAFKDCTQEHLQQKWYILPVASAKDEQMDNNSTQILQFFLQQEFNFEEAELSKYVKQKMQNIRDSFLKLKYCFQSLSKNKNERENFLRIINSDLNLQNEPATKYIQKITEDLNKNFDDIFINPKLNRLQTLKKLFQEIKDCIQNNQYLTTAHLNGQYYSMRYLFFTRSLRDFFKDNCNQVINRFKLNQSQQLPNMPEMINLTLKSQIPKAELDSKLITLLVNIFSTALIQIHDFNKFIELTIKSLDKLKLTGQEKFKQQAIEKIKQGCEGIINQFSSCNTKCPSCSKFCEKEKNHKGLHQCKSGHYLRSMFGQISGRNDLNPDLRTCDELYKSKKKEARILDKQLNYQEFTFQDWAKKHNEWDFTSPYSLMNDSNMKTLWFANDGEIGKQLCLKYSMIFTNMNFSRKPLSKIKGNGKQGNQCWICQEIQQQRIRQN